MNNSGQIEEALGTTQGPSPLSRHLPTDGDILNTFLKTTNLKATSNCYPPQGAYAPQFGLVYPKVPSPGSTELVIVCTNTTHSQATAVP